ncbi:hypothetical protein, partial [Acidisoma sp. S159]|uniref:hypothetical protein n=1 Tax=Acidisoma sp. S159 TaxID=1747225 RepID=UPI001C203A8A
MARGLLSECQRVNCDTSIQTFLPFGQIITVLPFCTVSGAGTIITPAPVPTFRAALPGPANTGAGGALY